MAAGWIVFIVLLGACAQEQKPKQLLTDEQMVRVLMDIYLTEEKLTGLALARDSADKIFPLFKEKIYESAQINDTIFNQSMEYYLAHPKKLERIYTAVIDSLMLREQAVSLDTAKTHAIPR